MYFLHQDDPIVLAKPACSPGGTIAYKIIPL
jgi:hypothetical protein